MSVDMQLLYMWFLEIVLLGLHIHSPQMNIAMAYSSLHNTLTISAKHWLEASAPIMFQMVMPVYQAGRGIFAWCREIQMNPRDIREDDFPIAFESISKTASIIVRFCNELIGWAQLSSSSPSCTLLTS
jgi:hypothetical protein